MSFHLRLPTSIIAEMFLISIVFTLTYIFSICLYRQGVHTPSTDRVYHFITAYIQYRQGVPLYTQYRQGAPLYTQYRQGAPLYNTQYMQGALLYSAPRAGRMYTIVSLHTLSTGRVYHCIPAYTQDRQAVTLYTHTPYTCPGPFGS